MLLRGEVPLLNHHTSGVRMEWYRDDLEEHQKRDPLPILKSQLIENGIDISQLAHIEKIASNKVNQDYEEAVEEEDPSEDSLLSTYLHPLKYWKKQENDHQTEKNLP